MKYIGIRGHRGSGKHTIGILLGHTIEVVINKKYNKEEYKILFNDWVKEILENDDITSRETYHVYFDSFADAPITMINMIFDIPIEYLQSNKFRDDIYINLKTFECIESLEAPAPLTTAYQLFEKRYNEIDCENMNEDPLIFKRNLFISLRNLLYYFGVLVVPKFFGLNIWVKSLERNTKNIENFYRNCSQGGYRLFSDVKLIQEVDFIKKHNGVIIRLLRPTNIKNDSLLSNKLDFDNRYDYTIELPNDDLYSLSDQIWNLANNIILKTK